MQISAAPPHRTPSLLRFLRQWGYAVEEVDEGVVEIEDETLGDALTLSRRLLIWSQANNGDAGIIGDGDAAEVAAPVDAPEVAAK